MRFTVIIGLIFSFSAWNDFINAAELYLADGEVVQGKLIQIEQNQFTLQTDSGKRTFPADEIIRVESGKLLHSQPREGLVILANDDRIFAELLRSEEDVVFVRLNSCPETGGFKIPLETIQAASFQWPSNRQLRTELIQKIARKDQKSDLFFLNNGDNLEGELLGFDASTFRFESRGGETSVPRKGIRFFTINPELINFPQPEQLRYRIRLTNGSQLTVSSLILDKNEITAKTLFGAELHFGLKRLVSITPLGGQVVPLSDLKPVDYQFTPYFSQAWNWQQNRNVLSGPLRVGGKEFVSGLGMHSASELHYQLDGKYAAFQTEVGIDDTTQGKGDAEIVILVDQRIVFQQAIQGASQQTVLVPRIDLSGARELILKVNFGKNADIQDHVNWCRPVLIRQK
ncbi:MAG: NPCBM/NEW2 domain-containing protein [Planctomycetes bacterium]|nr:NPCBM/NEW2 domain-containing protein [Planctomycetota bacterium]MCH9778903.1 NPCBM/NEW2 domain-containing protein [Planctomycetota bacterium]